MVLSRLPWRTGVAQCRGYHNLAWARQAVGRSGAPGVSPLAPRTLPPPACRPFSSGTTTTNPPPPSTTVARATHYVSGPDPTASFDAILDDNDEDRPDFDWARDRKSERGRGASTSSASSSSTSPADARDVGRAVALAAAALARRPHGRIELEDKLMTRHGLTRGVAAAGVARLVALGLQSDTEFASAFARGKWRAGAWAPRRIAAELGRRGVGPGPVAAALEGLFGSANPRLDTGIRDGMDEVEEGEEGGGGAPASPSSTALAALTNSSAYVPGDEWLAEADRGMPASAAPAHLLASAARQAALSKGLPLPARRRRLVGWLQRRGHNWGTVAAVLDALAL